MVNNEAAGKSRMLSRFWDALWEKEQEFLESGKGEFRHGTSFVGVSSIAEQYYSQQGLELLRAYGESR